MNAKEAADRVAIGRLIDDFVILVDEALATYPFALDGERAARILTLFAKDGVLHMPFGRAVGHSEIMQMWQDFGGMSSTGFRPKYLQHHVTSRHIIPRGGTATGISYVLALSDKGVDHWGRYDDTFVKLDEGWYFAERLVTVIDSAKGSWYEGVTNPSPPRPTF